VSAQERAEGSALLSCQVVVSGKDWVMVLVQVSGWWSYLVALRGKVPPAPLVSHR
jgi:hypothetical protein